MISLPAMRAARSRIPCRPKWPSSPRSATRGSMPTPLSETRTPSSSAYVRVTCNLLVCECAQPFLIASYQCDRPHHERWGASPGCRQPLKMSLPLSFLSGTLQSPAERIPQDRSSLWSTYPTSSELPDPLPSPVRARPTTAQGLHAFVRDGWTA